MQNFVNGLSWMLRPWCCNKIISKHLLKLKKKTWELQTIHISSTWWHIHIVILNGRGAHKSNTFFSEMKSYIFQLPIIWRHPNVSFEYQRIILSKWVLNLIFSGSIWSLQCRNYFEFYDAISVLSENKYGGWLCNRKFGVFTSFFLSLRHN